MLLTFVCFIAQICLQFSMRTIYNKTYHTEKFIKICLHILLFQSPNTPTIPRERIHRITTMYPEDPRAPFYDPTSAEMKPLAKLYLTREAVIQKSCDEPDIEAVLSEQGIEVAENTEDTNRRNLLILQ